MALYNSFEKAGNTLFRYRGQIPVALFVLSVPVIYYTNINPHYSDVYSFLSWISVFISFCGLAIRSWTIGTTPKGTSGRNTKNQVAESLNSAGIYSILRHPLYLGNYLIWIGIVMFTFNIYFFIIVSLAFWLFYERIMFAEERFLERKFGNAFLQWADKVPAFIPDFRIYQKSPIPFSFRSVLRREYSGFFATVIGFVYIDLIRHFLLFRNSQMDFFSIYVFVFALIITLIIRTIKHKTKLLDETDRS